MRRRRVVATAGGEQAMRGLEDSLDRHVGDIDQASQSGVISAGGRSFGNDFAERQQIPAESRGNMRQT
jgi:hypothetical protein